MIELLNSASGEIAIWLESRLPSLGEKWWAENVLGRLTFQQQRLVEEKRISKLERLDLAALLRVLDQNWHELAAVYHLPKDARNWVKELQGVRNRWAHAPSSGLSPKDTYRDADTLARLLDLIQANASLQSRLETFKSSELARMGAPEPKQAESDTDALAPKMPLESVVMKETKPASKFAVGQLVCLRSNPDIVFPIIEVVVSSTSETRYRVFENGARQVYYETQISALEEPISSKDALTATELSALLTSIQLSSPSASALYCLNSGRVRFVPYQYRPVFKLIRSDRPRLLIADEVGVGKTIEAGLILKELQARSDIKSVLIICPKALVAERKWELEMKRFDEHFLPLDGRLLRHCVKETHLSGEWPVQYEKVIIPTSLFDNDLLFGKPGTGKSRDLGLLELDPPPKFDLVIVDEAHHIRNSETFLHQAVRYFADNAEAVLFLSATPVQLGREDLYTLLNVLRPDVIIDPASFGQMAEPNQHINHAIQACRLGGPGWTDVVQESLRIVANTTWGRGVLSVNPGFQHIYDGLSEAAEDGVSRIKTIQALEDIYTFSSLINRTRRRDIGEFTTRKAETVSTDFTPNQRALHDDLLSVIGRILGRLHGNQNVKFMMTTVSRQASSSLYGLVPALEDALLGKLNRLENDEDEDEEPTEFDSDFVESIRSEILELIARAKKLDPVDPKAEAFLRVVSDKVVMPKNKVLMFSTFRHTLRYLAGKLRETGIRFDVIHGGVPDDVRAILRRRFSLVKEDPEALDVLLSSEVGCEGLDFQFCDCLVNYDLPWNPMRIEQRIGRIDRYGQESQAIAIFNFVTPGTIDAEIYDRCLSRIGVFQHAIGGNEEILGAITRELHDIANSFSLSEAERGLRIKQLSDNKIRQIEEEQKLEERQGELFGLNLEAASWEQRLDRARNFWLEPAALSSAVSTYLSKRLDKVQEYFLGDKQLKTLRVGVEGRAALLEDYRAMPRSTEPTYRTWEKWLKGGSPSLSVTFEQECAVENADAVLLSLGHPLLKQAAAFLRQLDSVKVKLSVTDDRIAEGIYPFALYSWNKQGVKRDEELVPVASHPDVTSSLLELLQVGQDAPDIDFPDQQVWDDLDGVHHQIWLTAATEHGEENHQLVGVRIQSLTASHRARVLLLNEQIVQATNEKIRLMKRAELQRAQADFESRVEVLKRCSDSGDIRATPTVFGVIEIRSAR
jgi:ATP-dependent helicase HepA